MFNIMEREFGNNFQVTDKIVPAEFFHTMFNSITNTIEETRLMYGSKVRNTKP